MKRRHLWKFALLLIVPVAVYFYVAERNSWRPKTIELRGLRPGRMNFSPDGRYLLVSNYHLSAPGAVICDVATRRAVKTIEETNFHFLEEGNRLAVIKRTTRRPPYNYQTRLLSFPNLQPLKQHPSFNSHQRFKATWPNDKTLAAQNKKGDILLWDTQTGGTRIIKLPLLAPAPGSFYNLEFMPDRETVLVSETSFRNDSEVISSIQSWNIQTKQGHFIKGMRNLGYINAASNGIGLFGEHGNREIWDYKKEQRKRVIKGSFEESCLSPDGSLLATISTPNTGNSTNVALWDANSGQRLRILQGRRDGFQALAFSPDGRTLACGGYGFVQLWRVK